MPEARAFTAEQAAAIARREGPLLLSAAAGSGKTTVLVERFVRMVVEDEIAPGRILVITFTEKAAGELRARIRAALLARGLRSLAQDAEAAWISTFHGFCARVLRAHAVAAGLDPGFAVLDEAAGRELRSAAFEEALAGLLGPPEDPPRGAAVDLLAAWTPDRLRTAVLAVYAQLRSAGHERSALPALGPVPAIGPRLAALGPARAAAASALESASGKSVDRARAALGACAALLDADAQPSVATLDGASFKQGSGALKTAPCEDYLAALAAVREAVVGVQAVGQHALIDELLGRYADAYAAAKRARSAVDFDDLELIVARLLDEGLAPAWRARFERIMVDEFQDTNEVQAALLERLDAGQTFRVGDELQSIYGFRHASVEQFRRARERLGERGAVALLTQNWRTRPAVLGPINAASAALHERFEPLVPGRGDEPAGAGPRVELLVTHAQNGNWEEPAQALGALPGGPAWRWAEARLLAQRIAELVEGRVHRAGEIVVLLRAASDIACFERAIEERGISTLAAGGRGFWARQQVADLTQLLAALANPRDEAALLGVLASPLGPGLGSDALALLAVGARRAGRDLWPVVQSGELERPLPAADARRLADWAAEFAAERARAPRLTLAELLIRAIARSGYDERVLRLPGGVRRLANVRKLVRLAEAYERESGRGVRGFIDRATAELEADARESDAPVELAGMDAVRLMTIHAAKGLEFPVVALADLGRAPMFGVPDVLVEGDRVALRVITLQGDAESDGYEELKEARQAREREESLRVFHVAMTRAQERLILSGATNVEKWPTGQNCPPLVWLGPALVPALGERLLAEGPVLEADGVRAVLSTPENGTVIPAPAATPAVDEPPVRAVPPAPMRPAPAPPPPVSTLSYSALSRYAQCGYRFYLERVLRLPEQDPPPTGADGAGAGGGLDPLVRGSIAHELLERMDLAAPAVATPEEIALAAARHEAELTEADVADIGALLAGAIGSDVMRRVAAAAERHVEEAFALALTGVQHAHVPLFTGYIDLRAVEADGTALIVDYKTERLDGADPEAVVAAGYGVQRRLYALAALRAGAPRVEVAHLFLERPAEPALARYEAADAERLEAELAARAAGVLAHEFPVADRPHRELCATCPGRGGLCSYTEEEVLVTLGG